jgi:hypothetical protein
LSFLPDLGLGCSGNGSQIAAHQPPGGAYIPDYRQVPAYTGENGVADMAF